MSIKNLAPRARRKKGDPLQNYYVCNNPDKYLGDLSKIIYRSSWELKFMIFCDNNPDVIKWDNEPFLIPYISPLDNRQHSYWVDFYVKMKTADGGMKEYLVEVKPLAQFSKEHLLASLQKFNPNKKPGKRRLKTELEIEYSNKEKIKVYNVNIEKFKYAKKYAEDRGMTFKVMSEEELVPKPVKVYKPNIYRNGKRSKFK